MNIKQSGTAIPIYWTILHDVDWTMHIAATHKGLCFVGSHDHSIDELLHWTQARYPGSPLLRDDEKLRPYVQELIEYLKRERKSFSRPIDVRGSDFQITVWKALLEIPYGLTITYSDIANYIRKPASVRAVGTAIGANPLLITVPCHRVIGKNGLLTGYRGGLEMKTRLLELEKEGLEISAEANELHAR